MVRLETGFWRRAGHSGDGLQKEFPVLLKRVLVLSALLCPVAWPGAIVSGGMDSSISGFLRNGAISLSGITDSGGTFVVNLGGPGVRAPLLGNERCPNVSGSPNPMACTWSFSSVYTLNVSDGPTAGAGQQVQWNGVTYDFAPGTPYAVQLALAVNTNPVTVLSTISSGVHSWDFPSTLAGLSIGVTISQGSTILVSETVTGNAVFAGHAFQAPIGSEWAAHIEYDVVPEPATWTFVVAGACVLFLGYRRAGLVEKGRASREFSG